MRRYRLYLGLSVIATVFFSGLAVYSFVAWRWPETVMVMALALWSALSVWHFASRPIKEVSTFVDCMIAGDTAASLVEDSDSPALPCVEVTVSKNTEGVYMTVSDNGCGVPNGKEALLFQPFFTTKKEGSGIGLCISRQIVRMHGGDIHYHSRHQGSIFSISIPAVTSAN